MALLIVLAWWASGFLSLLGVLYIINSRENSKMSKADVIECLIIGLLGVFALAGCIGHLLDSDAKK